jgi:carboxymethylenebutenolidase
MGQTIKLTASDGHSLSAYQAGPGNAKKGLVLIQEIFGVNHHIRGLCDRFAADGYDVIAPAMFDRAETGMELGYGPEDRDRGLAARGKISEAQMLLDVEAAAKALGGRALGIVGYCMGGTVAWHGACRTDLFKVAVGWYGGGIAKAREEAPRCPVQLHFGEKDQSIPMSDVELVRKAHPEVEIYVYEGAGHGFGCDERATYDAAAYALARERTLTFLSKSLPG